MPYSFIDIVPSNLIPVELKNHQKRVTLLFPKRFFPLDRPASVTGVKAYREAPHPSGKNRAGSTASSGSSGSGSQTRNRSQGAGSDASLSPSPRGGGGQGKTLVRESSTSSSRVQRQRSLKNTNDEALKRSRPHQAGYQLSQDLHDKQATSSWGPRPWGDWSDHNAPGKDCVRSRHALPGLLKLSMINLASPALLGAAYVTVKD
ncbi:hypothetical protein ElyMa_000879200 [Elysia marginata]|uniref:Uncharacterized protein n=1 Tax=Elysia marginata TaxID=1093978 RepID=A0AAV4H774_9GAST|nr:hypothetical protein ElyMa_000879200 [Elysia marginata]